MRDWLTPGRHAAFHSEVCEQVIHAIYQPGGPLF